MSANCNVIINFPIYGQYGTIWKPDSGNIVYKIYIFIESNLLSYKNWKQNLKTSNTNLTLLLRVKLLFLLNAIFLQKMLTSAKLRGPWYWKVYFLELNMCVYLRTKFRHESNSSDPSGKQTEKNSLRLSLFIKFFMLRRFRFSHSRCRSVWLPR